MRSDATLLLQLLPWHALPGNCHRDVRLWEVHVEPVSNSPCWRNLNLVQHPHPLAAFHWRRAVARCRQHNCPRIRLTLAVSSTKTPYWSLDPTVPHVRNVSDIPNHPFEGRSPWFCNGSVIRCSIIPINWMIGASGELLQGLLAEN